VSGSKQIIVHRSYEPTTEACIRAVELLLTTPCKVLAAEQTPKPCGPDDAEDLKHDRTATEEYNA
jgi:hypothetical protein